MVHWTPETFVGDGDQIAMFGRCGWRHQTTNKVADIAIAHLWTFKEGKAVEVKEIFDSARVVAAATLINHWVRTIGHKGCRLESRF
jgi:ketosteroid isomerase-like protein